MAGHYVRAVFDFPSMETGDLPFRVSDIIQIVYDVDENWTCGKLYGRVGNFPKNFVVPLKMPDIGSGQKMFAAIKDFDSDVEGDLCFKCGDLVKGEKQIDLNWWQGVCDGRSGIFPITHVQQLDVAPGGNQIVTQKQSIGQATDTPPADSEQQTNSGIIAKGVANMDLAAQLDDELSFHNGDIIEITQVLDSDFAIGKCRQKSGSFPLAFVDITEGSVDVKEEVKRNSKFDWWKEGKSNGIEGAASVSHSGASMIHKKPDIISSHPPPHTQQEPLQDNTNLSSVPVDASTDIICHDPRISSATYVPQDDSSVKYVPQVDIGLHLPIQSHNANGFFNQHNTYSQGEGGITPYGKTLFPFVGENPNELTIFDNEIVTLVRHVDDQWIEGEFEGKRGIFPVSYVEIIVDCPYDYAATPSSQSLQTLPPEAVKMPVRTFEDDMYGCVLYDFVAEMSGDLSLCEGDTIRVISKVDNEWYEAVTDDGRIGMCPITYVEPIPAEPHIINTPNGCSKSQQTNKTIITNNNVAKHKCTSESADKPSKPAITRPKPPVKPKPHLSPDRATDGQEEPSSPSHDVSVGYRDRPPTRPPRPAINKQVYLTSGLDDLIQNELSVTKQDTCPESKPAIHSLTQDAKDASKKSLSVVEMESMTSPVSLNEPWSDTASDALMAASAEVRKSCPKKLPPPRPLAHPTPHMQPLQPEQTDFGPRIVPQRAAPPRPSGGPIPAPRRKRSGDDLMEFSPDDAVTPGLGDDRMEQNLEVIQDMEMRLTETRRDLQKCDESKKAVEAELSNCTNEVVRRELMENIEFYSANIDGLAQEIEQLTGVLVDLQPEKTPAKQEVMRRQEEERQSREDFLQQQASRRQKHRETRQRVIAEIIQTEKDYLHSISLCFETFFHTDAFKCPGVDAEMLLGNIDEVCELSQNILTSLEAATGGIEFDEQVIGICFLDLKEELKRVYAPYCRNHDDVLALLAKYERDSEIQACFNEMLEVMRKQTSVFDLGSILIKPVQRILKYPLLLNELVKCTEDDHLDKPYLIESINAMTDVAATINEYKRRKDLVLKYKNTGDVKFSDKMAKLNMHSTKKKLQRFSQKMVGIQTIDESFIREERKFKNLELAVRVLVRDVSNYVENVQATCQSQEILAHDVADYYSDKSCIPDVEQFCKVHSEISSRICYKFKEDVECKVITPVNRLLAMFQGPIKVIKKRHDKLLDYDNLSSRIKNMRDQEQLRSEKESLQSAKNNYEALNAQLLDELPKLHVLSLELLQECIGHLVQAQRDYYNKALEQMYHMLGLQLVLGHDLMNIIETFNISHTTVVEQLSEICFIPKSFNPRIEEKRATIKARRSSEMKVTANSDHSCVSQSDSQKAYIRQQYPPDKLYTVTQSVGACQDMDLDLAQGVLCGVIKEGDPMGNKDHWFIDTGATKGFIMKHFLSPSNDGSTGHVPEVLNPSGLQISTQGSVLIPEEAVTTPSENLMDLMTLLPESPSPVDVNQGSLEQQYQAIYPFASRSELEVDLIEGETVQVIDFHDQDGNPDWWLVRCADREGFAPANYLYKVD